MMGLVGAGAGGGGIGGGIGGPCEEADGDGGLGLVGRLSEEDVCPVVSSPAVDASRKTSWSASVRNSVLSPL
jgi:hypothetical protein